MKLQIKNCVCRTDICQPPARLCRTCRQRELGGFIAGIRDYRMTSDGPGSLLRKYLVCDNESIEKPAVGYYHELARMGVNVAELKKANLSEAELSALVGGIRELLDHRHKTSSGLVGMGFVAMSMLFTAMA